MYLALCSGNWNPSRLRVIASSALRPYRLLVRGASQA